MKRVVNGRVKLADIERKSEDYNNIILPILPQSKHLGKILVSKQSYTHSSGQRRCLPSDLQSSDFELPGESENMKEGITGQ
jgi:hypothetical protein